MSCLTQPSPALLQTPTAARSMSKPIVGTLATNMLVFALGLGSSVLLNRSLGPEGKGLYATLLTTSQLLIMLGGLGLGKSVTFYLANREEDRQSVFGVFLSLTALAAVLCLLAAFGTSLFAKGSAIYQGAGLYALAALTLFSFAQASGLGVLRGLKEFAICNVQSVLTTVVFIAATIVLVVNGNLDPISAVFCKALSFFAGLFWIWARVKALGFRLRPTFEGALAKKMMTYGLGFFLYALFQNLSYRFDLILVANMTSLADAGWYSTASGLAEIIWYFPNAIGTVLFPVIAGLDDDERDKLVCKTCRWSLLVMALGVACLVLMAPVGVPLLYGNRFLPTVGAIYSLAFGIITNGMFQILGIHLAAKKRLGALTLITATGFALNLALNLVLIPRFGIIGAGLSSTLSYSVCGFLTAWIFIKITGRKWAELFLIPKDEIAAVPRSVLRKMGFPSRTIA